LFDEVAEAEKRQTTWYDEVCNEVVTNAAVLDSEDNETAAHLMQRRIDYISQYLVKFQESGAW
jgi:hypothetical protein